jgi:hypothetical protein
MNRSSSSRFFVALLILFFFSPMLLGEKKSDSTRLELLPEWPKGVEISPVYVQIRTGKKILWSSVMYPRRKTPLTVTGLPPGDVVVQALSIPTSSPKKKLVSASGRIRLEKGKLHSLKLDYTEKKPTKYEIRILENGKPKGKTHAGIETVGLSPKDTAKTRLGRRTNADGYLTFYGFSDEQYQLAIREDVGSGRPVRTSGPVSVPEKGKIPVWNMKPLSILTITVMVQEKGKLIPFVAPGNQWDQTGMRLRIDGDSRGFHVVKGKIRIWKHGLRIKKGDVIQPVVPDETQLRDYAVLKGASFRVDEKTSQDVTVVLRKKEYVRVSVTVSDPKGKALERPTVWFCQKGTVARIAWGAQPRLEKGEKEMYVWSRGYHLKRSTVSITAKAKQALPVRVTPTKVAQYRLVGPDGSPVHRFAILRNTRLPAKRMQTFPPNSHGVCQVSIDTKVYTDALVVTKQYGLWPFTPKKSPDGKIETIQVPAQMKISGAFKLAKGIGTTDADEKPKQWYISWTAKRYPEMQAAGKWVAKAAYALSLPAGKYQVVISDMRNPSDMKHYDMGEISLKEGTKELRLDFTVSKDKRIVQK